MISCQVCQGQGLFFLLQGVHSLARCDQIVPSVQDEGAMRRRGRRTPRAASPTSPPSTTVTQAPSSPCSSIQPPHPWRSSPLHCQQPLVQPPHPEVRAADADMRGPVGGAGGPLHGHLPHSEVHHHLPPLLPDHPYLRPCHCGMHTQATFTIPLFSRSLH